MDVFDDAIENTNPNERASVKVGTKTFLWRRTTVKNEVFYCSNNRNGKSNCQARIDKCKETGDVVSVNAYHKCDEYKERVSINFIDVRDSMRDNANDWALTKQNVSAKILYEESLKNHIPTNDMNYIPLKRAEFENIVNNQRPKMELNTNLRNFCTFNGNQNFLKSSQLYELENGEFGELVVFSHPYLSRLLQYSIIIFNPLILIKYNTNLIITNLESNGFIDATFRIVPTGYKQLLIYMIKCDMYSITQWCMDWLKINMKLLIGNLFKRLSFYRSLSLNRYQ